MINLVDGTTDGTTSHSAKPPKNGGQAAGYSHLTNPASEKLLDGHPKDAGQVIGYRLIRILLLLLVILYASASHAAKPPAEPPIRIGLTPVFLDYQAAFVNDWRNYMERHLERPVVFIQRGSYREIVDMLREGRLDFAWLCGYPYVSNRKHFRLVAVPLYQGEPLYRSYLIVPSSDKQTRSLADLRWKIFAFSDPDSNSGHLYTEYLLAKQDESPSSFFSRTFFTWSHRKVVEAVASGLAQGGSVDGYVWDTLALSHPELTAQTRIVNKSPQFGHPPFVASNATAKRKIAAMQRVLLHMADDTEGLRLLSGLNLDGFVYGNDRLFDSIEEMSRFVAKSKNDVPQRP
jgi:phosphonate transport system substrate-binding protein